MRVSSITRLLMALMLVLIIGLGACNGETGSGTGDDGSSGTPPSADDGDSGETGDFDFSVLNGWWAIEKELTYVEGDDTNPMVRMPVEQWQCTVEGDQMTLQTLTFSYSGTLTAESDRIWEYEGSSESRTDDGDIWSSTVKIRATMDGENALTGTMLRSVDSDLHGNLFTVTWAITGERMDK